LISLRTTGNENSFNSAKIETVDSLVRPSAEWTSIYINIYALESVRFMRDKRQT
jgi:hypothetical protein